MTVPQLAQLLLPLTRISGLDTLRADEAAALASCMNQAVHEWFSLAPSTYRTDDSLTFSIAAPTEKTSISLADGATTLSSGSFSASDIGKSIVLAGDAKRNEIASTTAVLHALDAGSAATTGTIYCDCLRYADAAIEMLTRDPVCVETGRNLQRLEQYEHSARTFDLRRGLGVHTATDPTHYWVESSYGAGSDSAGGDYFRLHLYPSPSRALTLRIAALVHPANIGIDDIQAVTSISSVAVPDTHAHSQLLPIAREAVMFSPIFDRDGRKDMQAALMEAAGKARALASNLSPLRAPKRARIRRRPGF